MNVMVVFHDSTESRYCCSVLDTRFRSFWSMFFTVSRDGFDEMNSSNSIVLRVSPFHGLSVSGRNR